MCELAECCVVHVLLFLVNKQLNDKERVAAALENTALLQVVNKCISNTDPNVRIDPALLRRALDACRSLQEE